MSSKNPHSATAPDEKYKNFPNKKRVSGKAQQKSLREEKGLGKVAALGRPGGGNRVRV